MFIRAYLRASTTDQDAHRAKDQLTAFAQDHGQRVAAYYIENESGATLQRPQLFRLLSDAHPGDVLLVEQVDRLSRLTEADWQKLRGIIKDKEVRVVSLDLPTSHQFVGQGAGAADSFTSRMLGAINDMLLDMLAAVARKDYEDRRRRQLDGIRKAKAQGAYKGRSVDQDKHQRIMECLQRGMGIREAARATGASTATIQRVIKLQTACT
ncbi:recombinase family protein [Pseudomonas sp. CFBP 8770]|uniref:recombinase family protein n=1 Tax=unclassified Pseudomonas TaxID=196821 RepID=UPI001782198D|nr:MULTISPECIES: recombinase family protein [unclassified Pseudomonas]MBD8473780.1 recombinase family protein [Pseudomonas sp. CFBP 8773]MBD8646909.1 recombinase family protein [Pseudomonas sp. CFBP 8770]